MFDITDADWRKLTLPGALPDPLRQALVNIGQNYKRWRDIGEDHRRAADVRSDLDELAELAGELAFMAAELDVESRMALLDLASDDRPTPRLDAQNLFVDHIRRVKLLEDWCRRAAASVTDDARGPAARASHRDWLVKGFAYAYAEVTGQPFTAEGRPARLLGDFVEIVDQTITKRQLSTSILSTVKSLQN